MVPQIPEDIWIQIIEEAWTIPMEVVSFSVPVLTSPCLVKQISLTNKALRRLALPFIFGSLNFYAAPCVYGDESRSIAPLIESFKKARCLLRSGGILQHVRQLRISRWTGHQTERNSIMVRSLAQAVYSLISKLPNERLMPRLREVNVDRSPITELLQASIFAPSRPLTRVSIETDHSYDIGRFSRKDMRTSIHKLVYSAPELATATHAHFAYVVHSCIPTLKALQINSGALPTLAACIAASSYVRIGLEDLDVEISPGQESSLQSLLSRLTALRSLEVVETDPIEPWTMSPDILPKLECLTVNYHLLPEWTAGRQLKTVFSTEQFDVAVVSVSDLIRCCPLYLRDIRISINFESDLWFLEFIRSLHLFENLESLEIFLYGRTYVTEYPHQHLRDEEVGRIMGQELQRWRSLRRCFFIGWLWEDDRKVFGPFHRAPWPIARAGDPSCRGHESLEDYSMEFLWVGQWYWIPGKGWISEDYSRSRNRGR